MNCLPTRDPWNRDREMTLEEIGRELGITKQGVRYIERRALEKLRRTGLKLFVRPSVRETP
jgi:DNA-directed RNA polymerase sigma subunit (sigma70/sigma32)